MVKTQEKKGLELLNPYMGKSHLLTLLWLLIQGEIASYCV